MEARSIICLILIVIIGSFSDLFMRKKRNKFKPELIALFIIIIIILYFLVPELFPGIRYPVVDYEIEAVNPVNGNPRLDYRDERKKYPEGFTIGFIAYGFEQFKRYSFEHIVSTIPYQKLYIKKISYEGGGGKGVFATNTLKEFSGICINDTIYEFTGLIIKRDDYILHEKNWWMKYENGWYDTYFNIISDEINFHKIFTNKKIGDIFVFKIICEYICDDGPLITQTLTYNVEAKRGKYRAGALF
jgi:hypothetical protein